MVIVWFCIETQFLGRLIRSPEVPEERGVWDSQEGGKDKRVVFFFPSIFLSFSHIKLFFFFLLLLL